MFLLSIPPRMKHLNYSLKTLLIIYSFLSQSTHQDTLARADFNLVGKPLFVCDERIIERLSSKTGGEMETLTPAVPCEWIRMVKN